MMIMSFNNRVFGCVIVKSINSNYNADFSHQPRTLPNGVVYATDKALKYAIKNYLKDNYPDEKIFYFKRFNNEFVPFSLDDAYGAMFPNNKDTKDKTLVAKDILNCLDIRLFGATFAKKGKSKESNIAISIHGPVQINHGVNIWEENNIFSEQIMSPFRNPREESEDKQATTLGRQSKLQEGHYLHHFSVNPKNLTDVVKIAGEGANTLTKQDIDKLIESLRKGVTYYDSAAKAGTDNEFLLWVKLNTDSRLVLPNFTNLVRLEKDAKGQINIDLSNITKVLHNNMDEIEAIEIYHLPENIELTGAPSIKTKLYDLTSGAIIQS